MAAGGSRLFFYSSAAGQGSPGPTAIPAAQTGVPQPAVRGSGLACSHVHSAVSTRSSWLLACRCPWRRRPLPQPALLCAAASFHPPLALPASTVSSLLPLRPQGRGAGWTSRWGPLMPAGNAASFLKLGSRLRGGRRRALLAWQGAEGSVPRTGGRRHLRASPEAAPWPGRGWTPPWTPPEESWARSRPRPLATPSHCAEGGLAMGVFTFATWPWPGSRGGTLRVPLLPPGRHGRCKPGSCLVSADRGAGPPVSQKALTQVTRGLLAAAAAAARLPSRFWVYLRMCVSPFFLFKK